MERIEINGGIRGCQSAAALSLQNRQNAEKLAELERQRRNLSFLVCRILQAAPEYRLHPEELAVGSVGDLSFLSQEMEAYLRSRMVRANPSQTSR